MGATVERGGEGAETFLSGLQKAVDTGLERGTETGSHEMERTTYGVKKG